MKTVTSKELAELRRSEKELHLVDVRTPAEFREMHLDFAQNVPLDRLDPEAVVKQFGSPDSTIYFICKAGSRGQMACQKLIQSGYENVANVEGGTQACLNSELNIIHGKKTISLERQVRIAAGSLVVLGTVLGFLAHPLLFGLAGFVGAGLVFAGVTDTCAMGMLMAKMPWNQVKTCSTN